MLPGSDHQHMAHALQLARRGLCTTMPNPRVGCVIAHGDEIVGEGWHQVAGEAHAEINALAMADDRARGATVYVTLEPCSHHGRTPPCVAALIAAGVARVVYGMRDPNPLVAGTGLAALSYAGIAVDGPLLESDAVVLNLGFISRMQRGRPWIRLKLAMSVDGRTAMASGESQWITGSAARNDVQQLRARSCAIVTGIGTVLSDDPALTVRCDADGNAVDAHSTRQPLRVVLDSQLRMRTTSRMLTEPGQTCIVGLERASHDAKTTANALTNERVEVLTLPSENNHVSLVALMEWLSIRQCNEVLVEAGATLAAAFVEAKLVDELIIYMAPTLLGSTARPLFMLPFSTMAQQMSLDIRDIRAVGVDWRITAALKPVV